MQPMRSQQINHALSLGTPDDTGHVGVGVGGAVGVEDPDTVRASVSILAVARVKGHLRVKVTTPSCYNTGAYKIAEKFLME